MDDSAHTVIQLSRLFTCAAQVIPADDDKRIMAALSARRIRMEIKIANGTTTVKNSPQHTPRCIDVNTHICGRTVESSAYHWPARGKGHADGERAAYISFDVKAYEADHEVPLPERNTELSRKRSTEQTTFLDVEDARALRDALTVVLDCADVK